VQIYQYIDLVAADTGQDEIGPIIGITNYMDHKQSNLSNYFDCDSYNI